MSFRYQYKAEIVSTSGGGEDEDYNPIPETKSFNEFNCDIQTDSGRYVVNNNGDRIRINYFISAPTSFKFKNLLKRGGIIRYQGIEWPILQFNITRLAVEIWV